MKIELDDKYTAFDVELGSAFYQRCCDCGLRHIVLVSRLGKNKARVVFMADGYGTDMTRRLHRYNCKPSKANERNP